MALKALILSTVSLATGFHKAISTLYGVQAIASSPTRYEIDYETPIQAIESSCKRLKKKARTSTVNKKTLFLILTLNRETFCIIPK